MSNININLAFNSIKRKIDGVSTYTFKDLGTSNMKMLYQMKDGKQIAKLYDKNTSNIDMYAIKAALNNLFSFLPGQQILQPGFGNTIYQYIYQPMNQLTQTNIIKEIKHMVELYQPRINLTDIQIIPDQDNMVYNITIKFYVPQLHQSSNINIGMSSEGIKFS